MDPIPFESAQRLGAVSRAARTRLGVSQAVLAERAGVTRQWLVLFETGRLTNPTLAKILKVTAALGLELQIGPRSRNDAVDLDDLMGRS